MCIRDRDVYHYHLHVVYIPVVEQQILWSKRCKDESLRGTEMCIRDSCYIEYMADVLTVGDLDERVALVDKLLQDDKIAFLQEDVYKRQVIFHEKSFSIAHLLPV